ncbi:OTU domain-containing protein 1 [Eumeta japonica]|uniref:OTU domain-containing protein 1 n=1 Tax=Eumeta variegata TaxID=151549 RepID=A0A4C1YZB0_EUMVA|nr:OTU domain-containing protein 1 [Eumeta japonica]
MAAELVKIIEKFINLTIESIVGDGVCLFSRLSYLLYGTQERSMDIRKEIVRHVTNNWNEFAVLFHDHHGNNHETKEEYTLNMLQKSIYGGFCELIAAGQIYPFIFELYRNGNMHAKFDTEDQPITELRFSQDLSNGHFDTYADADGSNNTDERPIAKKQRMEMRASPKFSQPSPISNVV